MVSLNHIGPKFSLGQVVATPGVLAAFEASSEEPGVLLRRHTSGDWGLVSQEDAKANDEALAGGGRLLSRYRTRQGRTIWIITEADRSSTTLLLPEEY